MEDFTEELLGEQNRELQRKVGRDYGPDAGLLVDHLSFRGMSPEFQAAIYAAQGQGLQAPPAGQLGGWFVMNHSIMDGPDLVE